MENEVHLSALTGEVEVTHEAFTDAHSNFEHSRNAFNIAVNAREGRKAERLSAIQALEKRLKQLKREV